MGKNTDHIYLRMLNQMLEKAHPARSRDKANDAVSVIRHYSNFIEARS
jgi:hypothetical protein